jgi:membrane protein required for colicin V production
MPAGAERPIANHLEPTKVGGPATPELHSTADPYGEAMNVVDLVVVGLLVVNTILGAVRGFALQAFRLGSIVLAIWLAHRFAGDFADATASLLDWPRLQLQALGWVVIGGAVYLAMLMLGHYARGLIERLRMGGADRALGALLGGLKGMLLALIGLHVITAVVSAGSLLVPESIQSEMKESRAFEIYLTSVRPLSEEWVAKAQQAIAKPK